MLGLVGDHPTIRNMELTGTPNGKAEMIPICPVCGQEADYIYENDYGEIAGCDNCLKCKSAWDMFIEQEV